jgi:DNA primase
MTPEPVLCFDGDNAGIRATIRAAERALPLLKPGYSLRFVTLPEGEDPDTLIEARGLAVMEELLKDARPLDAVIWDLEKAKHTLDTPERLAGLEYRLEQRARSIADHKVQYQYLDAFRSRIKDLKYHSRRQKFGSREVIKGQINKFRGVKQPKFNPHHYDPTPNLPSPPLAAPEVLNRRREQALLAALLNHWPLMDDFAETVGTLEFFDPYLDKLRQEILLLYGSEPDLEPDGLNNHLKGKGYAELVKSILNPVVYIHAGFARTEAEISAVRVGIGEMVDGLREEGRKAEMAEAEKAYVEDPTEENWSRLQECMVTVHRENQINQEKDYPESVVGDGLKKTRNKLVQKSDENNVIKGTSDNVSGPTSNGISKDLEINC